MIKREILFSYRVILYMMFALFISTTLHAQESDSLIRISNYQMGNLYKTVSYNRVSVHDPSIAVNVTTSGNKYYYIFGSHLGVAYTTDLKNWNNKYNTGSCNGLFGTISSTGAIEKLSTYTNAYHTNQTKRVRVLQGSDTVEVDFGNFDASEWNTSSGQELGGVMWAPDVIYNPTLDKWCMYMSLNGDNWRSVIVLLTSANITGPYIYEGPVVYSGFQWTSIPEASWKLTDLELVIGTQTTLPSRYNLGSSWGNRWPNVIDPCVFYDEEGTLWMAYGSWSGGIFILQLDSATGLRDYTVTYPAINNNSNAVSSDPYYGRRIAGGYYVSGEGAYIKHIGNYYYLFVTYGGLTADGGYEMHIFRSSSPDGPYIDSKNNSAVYTSYKMNYGPNAACTYGEKIIGAYQWDNMSTAELSQGHNSAFVDDDGNAYIVYHTRFNDGSEGHAVRVHQLFLNKEGWLVAAPYEYMGNSINHDTIATHACCTPQEIVGSYQVLTHKYKMNYANKAYQSPFNINLCSDGSITGDYTGKWETTEGTSYISIILKSSAASAGVTYSGIVVPQRVSGTNMDAICFTAASTSGINIWGSKADGKLAVDCSYQTYKSPVRAAQSITSSIDLKNELLKYGATIRWQSDRPDVISDEGDLYIPTNDSTISVKLTYTIQKDNYYFDKSFTVKVKGDGTAVKATLADETKEEVMYDLYGRQIEQITRNGLYIINGKKIFINKQQ